MSDHRYRNPERRNAAYPPYQPPIPPRRYAPHRGMSLGLVLVLDALAMGVLLLIFALFHHVLPGRPVEGKVLPVVTPTPSAVTQTTTTTVTETTTAADEWEEIVPTPTPEPTPTPTPLGGLFGEKFADKFNADGTVECTENSYKSRNVNMTLTRVEEDGIVYFLTDIYLRDLQYLKTAFAGDIYQTGKSEMTLDIANAHNALCAISGDSFGMSSRGIVIRNGELFRETTSKLDVLVLFQDGTMETFRHYDANVDAWVERGVYQVWTFGPLLLWEGHNLEGFDNPLTVANPRSAIGYYEPGHYVFLTVDGRQEGYSEGMTLKGMSKLFYDLGCTQAYNLDGGQSATLTWMGQVANQPSDGGRPISDIVYIWDEEVQP